ncbi:MAG: hypothetical protein O6920_05565 [Chloroflexi bacterium]|nr:hypothetical protein [Chloroflexota bacterium]
MPTPTPEPQVVVHWVRFLSEGIGGEHVIVPLEAVVQVYVTLSATASMAGDLDVEVRKDLTVGPDGTEKLCFTQVALSAEVLEVGPCVFTADELTSSTFRQYFVRLYWNGTLIYSPVDPDTREYVVTKQIATPTPTP